MDNAQENSLKRITDIKLCPDKAACPYLEFRACAEVLAENERLKVENRDLRGVFDVATEAFKQKETEAQALRQENDVLRKKLGELFQRPFARNTDTQEEEPAENPDQSIQTLTETERKKRGAPSGHRGATRKKPEGQPDRTVFVLPEQCPQCRSHNISPCHDTEEHTQLVLRSEGSLR